MKSCRCANCSVASARYAWGFALLARDGWVVSDASDVVGSFDDAWLCPACSKHPHPKQQPGLAKSAQTTAPARRSRPRTLQRVLLVDDEDMVRRCTARFLADFEVVCVSSAAEALAWLETDTDFNAVLSDVMMPGMSGPELYLRCCEMYPQLARRFVFASGNPDAARNELLRAAASVGAEQVPMLLSKPCAREELVLAVVAAAAQTAARSGTYSALDLPLPEVIKYRG